MAGRQRTSFEKRERERRRQEKQAAKRARRHHDGELPPEPTTDAPRDTETEPGRLDAAEG
jgi:hypothetical protein